MSIQNDSQIQLKHSGLGLNSDMIKGIYNKYNINSPSSKQTYHLKVVDLKLDEDHALADIAAIDTLNKLGLSFAE